MIINKQIMSLLLTLGLWAPWPFVAPVPQTLPSDRHGPVSFMVSVVDVMGIHRCAAAWR